MKWNINQERLDEAREILGIERPVRIREAPIGMAAGKYHGLGVRGPTTEEVLSEPAHHITISSMVSDGMVNEVLWHEMTHAAQCEDFLGDEGDHTAANAGLRQAFGKEMRAIRAENGTARGAMTAAYGDVSFEVEARDFMDRAKKCEIIEVDKPKPTPKSNGKKEDTRRLWRVDMWDDNKKFVGTCYVRADKDYDAKKWARDNHMKGMKWSNNVNVYEIARKGVTQ